MILSFRTIIKYKKNIIPGLSVMPPPPAVAGEAREPGPEGKHPEIAIMSVARKRALVVDDSKSARLILRRMLEKYLFDVDTAASGEEALDYLRRQRPDVIFMDHMMPGMDGFQAVREIKRDPTTATIPVMMYTSKEGDVYLGEARALGAMGVLPKEVKQVDVHNVLEKLNLLPGEAPDPSEPAQGTRPAASPPPRSVDPVESRAGTAAPREEPAAEEPRLSLESIEEMARSAAADALRSVLKDILREHRVSLRRELLDGSRELIREAVEARAEEPRADTEVPSAHSRPLRGVVWAAVGAVMAVIVVVGIQRFAGAPQMPSAHPTASLSSRTLAVATAGAGADKADAGVKQMRKQLAADEQRYAEQRGMILDALEWALNRSAQYPYGEMAFGDERLAMLAELLSRLHSAGFHGVVRLDSHVGQYCLVRNAADELVLPAPGAKIGDCDRQAMTRDQAIELANRQSVGFANFIGSSPLVKNGDISVEIFSHGRDDPEYRYPVIGGNATAGDWNRVAAMNNRVDVTLRPALAASAR